MIIHVECLPDEALLRKLRYPRKQVRHHGGKSKVFNHLSNNESQWAMVDEDPGGPRHPYEAKLVLLEEKHKIRYYFDRKLNNKVFVLRPRLEDWIIGICKSEPETFKSFGLPNKPNDLHDIINIRLEALEKLLDQLLKSKNVALIQLQEWLSCS